MRITLKKLIYQQQQIYKNMPFNSVSIDNYVNVQTIISSTPTQGKNPNDIALFTVDKFVTGNQNDDYRTYINARSVGDDFGISSDTYALASTIFAQSPNLLTGKGNFIIIPLQNAVKGTVANFTTADISANLAGIEGVSNGEIKVTVDGQVFELTNLNFNNCNSWDQVKEEFFKKGLQSYADISILKNTGNEIGLIFSSKKVGTDGSITLEQISSVTGTDLSSSEYFNTGAGTINAGANPTGETLLQAKARVSSLVEYYGFFTNQTMLENDIEAVAGDTQAKLEAYFLGITSGIDVSQSGIATRLQASGFTRTIPIGYFNDASQVNKCVAGFASIGCSVNYSGSNTAIIMNLKKITGIEPDYAVTDSFLALCKKAGVYTAGYTGGEALINAQLESGNYFANLHDGDALEIEQQMAVFNYEKSVTKVPQNNAGALTVLSILSDVCERFITNGVITKDEKWNGETFGDRESFLNSIRANGYYLYYTPFNQQSQAERVAGIINFQTANKLAGGLRTTNIATRNEQ
tara:strand:+ start:4197 stop:5762 length:1566 start_codon:yes stop_codon:yes gene_type:complete